MVDDLEENEDIGPSSNIPSTSSPSIRSKINLDDLPSDPADRPPISSYHSNQIDDVRRGYLVKKAFQPRGHNFKWSNYSSGRRRFNVKWFDKYDWLEYSTKHQKTYSLCCYLFNGSVGNQGGREVFVSGGFCNWSKPGALKEHVVKNLKMLCERTDESSDVSQKEQMAIVVRYVDKNKVVKESLIGVANVRGQGYDGASNMQGKFNGLKALILRDNQSAHYIHCFAHQLQLVIVAVAKKHTGVKEFFESLGMVVNTVGASCKRKDMMLELKRERVKNEILLGEKKTGK
ncbi:uncharacterized protein LOC143586336 [Bidens hawaiensis]|uniref:uncharacterized protein LOC143586336 n=1 Tax=Bidens hawaiensis TaxID=980011 RepID=UPI004049016E